MTVQKRRDNRRSFLGQAGLALVGASLGPVAYAFACAVMALSLEAQPSALRQALRNGDRQLPLLP